MFSFHSFFQSGRGKGGEINAGHAVFHRQHIGFWQIVAGHYLTVQFRLLQKFPGAMGCGGVVQIKDPHHRLLPHSHIIADV